MKNMKWQHNENVWHAPNILFKRSKDDEYRAESSETNLDNIILVFRQQILALFIPADAGSDDAAENVLVASDAWQASLHLRQDHVVCRQEHTHVMHLRHRGRVTTHLVWWPAAHIHKHCHMIYHTLVIVLPCYTYLALTLTLRSSSPCQDNGQQEFAICACL